MRTESRRIPNGPVEPYAGESDLLEWLSEQFKAFGNVYRCTIYGANTYVVTDPECARYVLVKNWQNYVRGLHVKRIALLMGKGLIVSEGEYWKRQRRMMQPAFHQRAISALADVMIQANAEVLERWERAAQEGRTINVTEDVSRMVLEVVLRSLFGADYERVASHFSVVAEVDQRDLAFAQEFQSLGKIVQEIITWRRAAANGGMDILGMLMNAKDQDTGKAMSDRQVVNEMMTLIIAGHETTASTLNWTWYLLAHHSAVQEKLAAEIDSSLPEQLPAAEELAHFPYARQVLDEAMRLYPALWLMTRRSLKDDEIGGYFVPAGTEIYISPYLIHRHPALWDKPDAFDPERFSPGGTEQRRRMLLLPFSVGPRSCIGESFSRLEMQIHLIMTQKRLRLVHNDETQPQVRAGINLRSKYDFLMTPERRLLMRKTIYPGLSSHIDEVARHPAR